MALPPPGYGVITGRLAELRARQAGVELEELVEEYAPTLLIEASLDPARAEALLAALAPATTGFERARMARLRIEALLAARRLDAARAALREVLARPGSPSEWLVLRACQLPGAQLCEQALTRGAP